MSILPRAGSGNAHPGAAVISGPAGGRSKPTYSTPAPVAKPAATAAPAKPYVNPFTQPVQSNYNDQRPDWIKQGLPNPNAPQQQAAASWQPPQPPPMPTDPGPSMPPLPMPQMKQQAPDAGEGWDVSGASEVAPGLGQRRPPSSMSALASEARLY